MRRALSIPLALCAALALGAGAARAAAVVTVSGCFETDLCSRGGPASGNGAVDPGEEGDLVVHVRNQGNVTAARFRMLVTTTDPSLTLLLDTLDLPDLPAGAEADTPPIPYRVANDVACGVSLQVDITLAYNGTFRNDGCTIDIPVACFACGADPCRSELLIPFSAGPYGADLDQIAGDFTVPTLDGDFTFSSAWTGCDSYVFVTHFPTATDQFDPWNSAVPPLLQDTPRNVHYFFLSGSRDPAIVSSDIADMRLRTDAAIARLPVSDRPYWRARMHEVTTGALDLGNWITTFLSAHPTAAFAIDPFQRIRQTGLLYYLGVSNTADLQHLTNEVRHFNFERERQRQLDYETFLEIPVWVDVVMGGNQADITFPDAETMARYDTMLFDLSWKCSDPWNSRSCEWDYLANLYLCDPQDPTNCGQEFGRWITAYGRGGRWVTDMTPFLALIRNGGTRHVTFSAGYAYTTTFKIYLTNRHVGIRPESATWLYGGGGWDQNYNANHPPMTVEAPTWFRRAEVAALITGHGFGQDLANCAEFCNHQHVFTFNGTTSVMKEFPEAQTLYGCVDQIESGTIPNQYGTWHYGRGGWCPGLNVTPWRGDVTAGIVPGTNDVTYQGLYQGAPYVPQPNPNPSGFGGRIDMSSYLVYYVESPEDDCADGIDDDGDGFTDCADQGCESQRVCDGFDTDGDGTINSADCSRLGGTLGQSPAGFVQVRVSEPFRGVSRVAWPELDLTAGTSTQVDVMTGVVSELRADGNFSRGTCLTRLASEGIDDPRRITAPMDAYWYILRARNACGSTTFDPPELQVTSPCD